MNLELSSVQLRLLEGAQSVADAHVGPGAVGREAAHYFPTETLKLLADAGLMGVNVPATLGGAQAGVISYSLAVTAIAKADPAVAVTMCVNNMVAEVIAAFGQEAAIADHVPKIASGQYLAGSFCLSEPGSGSDAAAMQTRAHTVDGGWEITGTKAWITSGAQAGVYIVWAKVDDGDRDTISAFLMDPNANGVTIGRPEDKMGQHASGTVALAFDKVFVPEGNLLGVIGQGFPIAMMALDGGRVGIASQALGVAKAALEIAKRIETESVSTLAGIISSVDAAEMLALRAAWLKENKRPFTREASMAKLYASEVACEVCDKALSLLGPEHSPLRAELTKLLRDVRVTRIYEGTSEIQRIVIARDLLKGAN